MTAQATFSEHVGRLEARVGVFNDHVKASAHETAAELHTRADELRASLESGADQLGADMPETIKWFGERVAGLRAAVTTDIEAARAKHDAAKEANRTTRDAEVADAYAAATHAEAVAAIAESERAAIAALAARAATDELVAAAPH